MYNIKIINLENGNSINFSPLEDFAITDMDGPTNNVINLSTSQGFGQTGTTIQGTSVEGRTLTINGIFLSRSTELRKKLIQTITPQTNLKIIFDNKIFLAGYAKESPSVGRNRYHAAFQFIIYAPYPYWRSLDMIKTTIGGTEGHFSFPTDYGVPSVPDYHMFGKRTEESYKNIVNQGDVPVRFLIKFYARTTLVNPQIQNIETLEYIRVKKTMYAGDMFIIDMTKDRLDILYNGLDGINYFDIYSTIFKLNVGDNLIAFNADSNKEGLDCYVYHYLEAAGAYGDDDTYI